MTATGNAIKSFRDLRIWQMGILLAEKLYLLSHEFPKTEMYGLTAQIRRAVISIPSNIAEGHARLHTREYSHHLSAAQGSLAEVQTQLEIAVRLGYVVRSDLREALELAESLSKQMCSLREALFRRLTTTP